MKIKKNAIQFGSLLLALAFILSACNPAPAAPTQTQSDPAPVLTGAAQTAEARLTSMAQENPTSTPAPPTDTPQPTLEHSPTPEVIASPVIAASATSTQAVQGGDNAVFAGETIDDGTVFAPGATFTKTWRLLNTGSTTWGSGYHLVHTSDSLMGAQSPVALTISVPPNQIADISVEMKAPTTLGTHKGYWRMRNSSGQFFGDTVWLEISVATNGAQPTATPTQNGAAPTPTPTGGAVSVTNLAVVVTQPNVSVSCPHTYEITASFTLGQSSAVTYVWEAGSNTPGFSFNLPPAQTATHPAGLVTIPISLLLTHSGSGWIQFHVTAPQDVVSNQATFTLTCQ
jgi:hypothetical protein